MSGVTGYLLSLLLLLAIVASALTLAWRRRAGLQSQGRDGVRLRALAVVSIGGDNRLVLAECEGRRYLLAQNPQGVSLLDRLPDSPPSFEDVATTLGRSGT